MMSDAELRYLERYGPVKYARTARLIDVCMRLSSRPCTRGDWCDEGSPCARHERTPRVAERYVRMSERSK